MLVTGTGQTLACQMVIGALVTDNSGSGWRSEGGGRRAFGVCEKSLLPRGCVRGWDGSFLPVAR